jgi:hypothetical protein
MTTADVAIPQATTTEAVAGPSTASAPVAAEDASSSATIAHPAVKVPEPIATSPVEDLKSNSMPAGATPLTLEGLPQCDGTPQQCAKKLRAYAIAQSRSAKKAGSEDSVQAQAWLNLGNFHWWAYGECCWPFNYP